MFIFYKSLTEIQYEPSYFMCDFCYIAQRHLLRFMMQFTLFKEYALFCNGWSLSSTGEVYQYTNNQYDTGHRRGAVETCSAHTLVGTVILLYTTSTRNKKPLVYGTAGMTSPY